MSFERKKLFFAIGLVVIVLLIGYALWRTFFAPTAPAETSPSITPETQAPGALPGSGTAGERPVTSGSETTAPTLPVQPATPVAVGGPTQTTTLTLTSVRAPQLGKDGQSLNYYDPSDGRFYSVDQNGTVQALLNKTFPDAESVNWAPDASKAVVEFPDGANVMVDLASGKTATLPTHWEDFDFSPDSHQLITKSIGVDPSNRWLVIAEPTGSNAQTIAALGTNADRVQVSWSPNDQIVAFSDTGVAVTGFGRKQILAIGKNQENLPGLIVEGFSFDPLWNTTGSQLLYSTSGPSSNYQPQLWLTDGQSNTLGQQRRSIPLNTWADKCTFSGDVAVCAVPQSLPEGSGLQRALAVGAKDTVYRVDTRTGSTQILGTPETPTNMTNLNVSADGSTLFFQDAISGRLQSMRIR